MNWNEAVESATRVAEHLCREALKESNDPLIMHMAFLLAARTQLFKCDQLIVAADLPRFREETARVEKFVAEEVQLIAMTGPGDRIISIPIPRPGTPGPIS